MVKTKASVVSATASFSAKATSTESVTMEETRVNAISAVVIASVT